MAKEGGAGRARGAVRAGRFLFSLPLISFRRHSHPLLHSYCFLLSGGFIIVGNYKRRTAFGGFASVPADGDLLEVRV